MYCIVLDSLVYSIIRFITNNTLGIFRYVSCNPTTKKSNSEKIFRKIRKTLAIFITRNLEEILSRVFFVYFLKKLDVTTTPKAEGGWSREYFSLPSLRFLRSHRISSQFSHGLSLFLGGSFLSDFKNLLYIRPFINDFSRSHFLTGKRSYRIREIHWRNRSDQCIRSLRSKKTFF